MPILENKVIAQPFSDITALKAYDLTGKVNGVIGYVINFGLFAYDSVSVLTPDDLNVIQPDIGSGRWIRNTMSTFKINLEGKIDPSILPFDSPLQFKGSITVSSDFPTLAEVQSGWFYIIDADVTDNDPSKTNTGQSFIQGDEIAWNGTNWSEMGSVKLLIDNGTDLEPISPRGFDIETGQNYKINGTPIFDNVDHIDFNILFSGLMKEGRLAWDSDAGTIQLGMPGTNVNLQIGQKIYVSDRPKNDEAIQINNGQVVYLSSATGAVPEVKLASASDFNTSTKTIAVATEDIPAGQRGFYTSFGVVRDFDTSSWTEGTELWLSVTAGELTDTRPTAPNNSVKVGVVIRQHATEGAILVTIGVKEYLMRSDITKEPTGFTNPENIIVSYDSSIRTITLTGPVNSYYKGIPISSLTSGWTSSPHSASYGYYFLTYDGSSFNWVDASVIYFNDLWIAYVYYQEFAKFAIRECHGLMPWQSREEFHQTIGTYRTDGGNLSDYILNSTTPSDRRPSISSTTLKDEDLITVNPQLVAGGPYTIEFLTGTETNNFYTGYAEIALVSGSQPYWNEFSGGIWAQTLLGTGYYMSMWLMGIPSSADSGSQDYRYVWVEGQSQSLTMEGQTDLTVADLDLGTLTSSISEFVFFKQVVIRYIGGDWSISKVVDLKGTKQSQVISPPPIADSYWEQNGTTNYPKTLTNNIALGLTTANARFQVHTDSTDPTLAIFTNNATGSGSSDGLAIGVTTSARGLLRSAGRLDVTVDGVIRSSYYTNGTIDFFDRVSISKSTAADCYFRVSNSNLTQIWDFGLQYGGGGIFAIRDITAGNIPFYIEKGALDYSCVIGVDPTAGTQIGFGTATFTASDKFKINDGTRDIFNMYTDGTAKFVETVSITKSGISVDSYYRVTNTNLSQTWDFGLQYGGGGIFAIRDITAGNIPFYIETGAPDSALVIGGDETLGAQIGIGTGTFTADDVLRISTSNKAIYFVDTAGDDKTLRLVIESNVTPQGSPAIVYQSQIEPGATESNPGHVFRNNSDQNILSIESTGSITQNRANSYFGKNAYDDSGTYKVLNTGTAHVSNVYTTDKTFNQYISTSNFPNTSLYKYEQTGITEGVADHRIYGVITSITDEDMDFDVNEVRNANLHESYGLVIVSLPQYGGITEGTAMWMLHGDTATAISVSAPFSGTKDTASSINFYWETDQWKVQNLNANNLHLVVQFYGSVNRP